MRTRNSIKNSFGGVIYYLVMFLLGIATRKLTLINFDNKILGYAGVIENIFGWFAVSELGISTVIAYNLYKALADKDEKQVSVIMATYQLAYRIVGGAITVLGLVMVPLLPFVFVEQSVNWNEIYTIYLIQLIGAVSGYFMAYRRALFAADQRNFACQKIDIVTNLMSVFSRITVAKWLPLYAVYYCIPIFFTIIGNILVSIKYAQDYKYALKKEKVSIQTLKEMNFFKDVKFFCVRKFSGIADNSVDNIVISRVLGVGMVTLSGNYALIGTRVITLATALITGVRAGLGNLLYDKSIEKQKQQSVFWALDIGGNCVAAVVSSCLFVLYQPFMQLWLGAEFLLPLSYVLALSLNTYITLSQQMLLLYREPLGKYESDMWFYIIGALINIVGSFIVAPQWGITGIVLCTALGHIVIWGGLIHTVQRFFLPHMATKYITKHIFYFLTVGITSILAIKLTSTLPATIGAFFLRAICTVALSLIICGGPFLFGADAAYLRQKGKTIFQAVASKVFK